MGLNNVKFSNYSDFHDVNNAFIDFAGKLMQAVDEIAPYREFRVKGQTEESEPFFEGRPREFRVFQSFLELPVFSIIFCLK